MESPVPRYAKFSSEAENLQLAWTPSDLYALMFCPRFYQLTVLEGWRGDSLDLEFGRLVHSALEAFDLALLASVPWEAAQLVAVRTALEESGTWDDEGQWHPWGGQWLEAWRCKGTEKYKPPGAARPRKCPYAKVRAWFPQPAPSICGECGSEIETFWHYLPTSPVKNRVTLLRAVVWYTEDFFESKRVCPFEFPDGTPGVELSFELPLPWKAQTGERYWLRGRLDGLAQFSNEVYIRERKTTKGSLSKNYWAGFTPHVGVDTYDLVGSLLFPDLELRGVLVEAIQVGVTFTRTAFQTLYRNEDQRAEHLEQIEWWVRLAESYADKAHWPMNKTSCRMCDFRKICALERGKREQFLRADFTQRPRRQ